jgi:hypothetical protein
MRAKTEVGQGEQVVRGLWSVAPIADLRGRLGADQYSSASITVRTRVVTEGSAGSGDISSMSVS